MESNINKTMYQALKEAALDFPHGTAIYYQGKKISYRRFLKEIDKTASKLEYGLGIKPGDVVLLSQPNIPDVLILFYAINKIGAIANIVHPFTPYNQIAAIYKKTGSKYAFLFEQRVAKEVEAYRESAVHCYVTRVENYLPFHKKIVYHFMNRNIRKKLGRYIKFGGFNYIHKLPKVKEKSVEAKNLTNQTAVLLHSGSTTGAPKTICISNDAFNFTSYKACEFVDCTPEEIRGTMMMTVLPSFHGFGLCMAMHAPLINRFGCGMIPKFSTKEVINLMNHTKMSVIIGIPKIYEALLDDPKFVNNKRLKYLKVCFCGGDSMNVSLKERWDTTLKADDHHRQVFEGYGLTEAISVNCVNTYSHNRKGSIGYPASGVKFKIIDENEKELKPGELGEICILSGSVMVHYFKDDKATKATFTQDGYLKTGDIGYIDNDGYVFFKQRKKRVIKVSGVGVFPSEVEQLVESVPGVEACCAIRIPDEKLVNAIKIYVVAKFYDEQGMRRAIMAKCQQYLIRWSVPKEIEFIDELPYTLLGKVDFVKVQKDEDAKRGL